MNQHNFSPEEITDIIYSYTAQNMSMKKLAKKYQVSEGTIKRLLIKNNVEFKDPNFYKQKYVNYNYFDKIDNQNKAYVLGYLYADGCLTQGNYMSCSACDENIESLHIVKSELQSEHKILRAKNSENSYSKKNSYTNILQIGNQELYDNLLNLGLQPRKSLICKFPTKEQVPREFLSHFIRGYFDGNGSVYYTIKKDSDYIKPIVTFGGAKDILTGIKNNLNSITGSKAEVHSRKDAQIFEYKIGGQLQITTIYHYFYDEANLFLERKKKKFDEIMDLMGR